MGAATQIGPYEIRGLLGSGGMGEIYLARDPRLGRDVALKMLTGAHLDPQGLERITREARAASSLNHPNIVTVHEIGQSAGRPFIVMELVRGRTLRRMMREPWALDRFVDVIGQAARALAAAHAAGIVHRDIKPENIMIREDGYVKVVDFGIAGHVALSDADTVEEAPPTGPSLVGTPRYMSPEQLSGQPVSGQSDIFSLGVVAYEWAAGQHPFAGQNVLEELSAISASVPVAPSRLNREVSPAVDALIGELLGKDPTRRPNATEVIERVADLSVRSAGSVVPGSERGSPSPYVGRGREAAELRRAYHDAVRGSGVIVEVSGEPGIGKTTLVEHVLHDLGTDPTASYIARGRCSDRLAGTEAYLPFLEAFDSLLDGPGRETVARLLKTVGPSWYAQIAQRGEIKMSGDSQERLKRELVAVLEQLSIQRPLLLFFEDVHWADASTVDLLSYVAARFDGLRVLIIVSYRPSDLELTRHPILPVLQALRGKGVSRELVVDFLTREETAAYLAQVFPGGRFPELGSLIHEKTEGNPLFMVELVRNLRTRQIVVESGDTWELTQPIAEIAKDLPPSIRSLIQRKIDLLDEDERRLLVAASVQGVQFDTAVVAKAIDRGAEEVEAVLDVLERRHGFVHLVGEESLPDGTPSSQFRFVHVLYQKGLYATLRPVRRTSLTKAVAVALIGFYQGNTAPVAAQLAVLFEAAQDFRGAATYYLQAARHASNVSAGKEAILLARRGLRALQALPAGPDRDRLELQLQVTLGPRLTGLWGYAAPDVEQAFSRARAICDQLGDTPTLWPVLHGIYRYYLVRGRIEEGRAVVQQLLALAERSGDRNDTMVAFRSMGPPLIHLADYDAAIEYLEKSLALYDPDQHASYRLLYGVDHFADNLVWLSLALWLRGRPDEAAARSALAVKAAEERPYPFGLAFVHSLTAWFHQYRGDPTSTRHHAETAIRISQEHDFTQWLALGVMFRAWALVALGECDEGLASLAQGLASFRRTGAELNLPHFLSLLADAHLRAGDAVTGLDAIEEALTVAARNNDRCWEPELHRLQGELLLKASGSADAMHDAEDAFRSAIAVADSQRSRSLQLRAALSLSRLLEQQRRAQEAHGALAEALAGFDPSAQSQDLETARGLIDRSG
jgi:predicted ATPase